MHNKRDQSLNHLCLNTIPNLMFDRFARIGNTKNALHRDRGRCNLRLSLSEDNIFAPNRPHKRNLLSGPKWILNLWPIDFVFIQEVSLPFICRISDVRVSNDDEVPTILGGNGPHPSIANNPSSNQGRPTYHRKKKISVFPPPSIFGPLLVWMVLTLWNKPSMSPSGRSQILRHLGWVPTVYHWTRIGNGILDYCRHSGVNYVTRLDRVI